MKTTIYANANDDALPGEEWLARIQIAQHLHTFFTGSSEAEVAAKAETYVTDLEAKIAAKAMVRRGRPKKDAASQGSPVADEADEEMW